MKTDLWENTPEKIVPLMAPRGGIIMHHCLLLHHSPPTLSGMPRRMIALEYRAGNAIQLANNVWADTGFQVYGTASNRVKCVAMEMELPRDPLWLRYCGESHGDVFNQIGPIAREWNDQIAAQQKASSLPET
jgi:phytanoyl-CoA hydroxylase